MRIVSQCLLVLLLSLACGLPVMGAEDAAANATEPATEAVGDPATDPTAQALDAATGEDASVEEDAGGFYATYIQGGGWPMYAIIGLSVLMVFIILERIVNLLLSSMSPGSLVRNAKRLWSDGREELEKICKRDGSTLSQIVLYCIAHPNASKTDVNEVASEIITRDLRAHQNMNYWLAVVSTLSPLLGLLGTVLGMIAAFKAVAIAGDIGDVNSVAGGISQALKTTAAGLTVAVPALGAYHLFKVILGRKGVRLEDAGSELINEWYTSDAATEGAA